MFQLDAGQLHALDAQAHEHFVQRACAFLRSHAAADVARADDAQLARFVRQSRELAEKHRITSEGGIMKWALLRLVAGANFHETPDIQAFFAEQKDGERAVAMLVDRLGSLASARRE